VILVGYDSRSRVRARPRESPISFLKSIRAATRASQFATQLRDRFARQPKWKAFVGWQSYYRVFLDESPGHALVDFRGPYVGDERPQVQISDAIVAGKRAFLLTAPSGCGKSRFALELARRFGKTQPSWDVRFVRHDQPALHEEMHELTKGKRLVLVVDDADHSPALVEQLAALCSTATLPSTAEAPSQIHLVCLAQPAGRATVTQALANHFPVTEVMEIDLGRPDAKRTRELIDKLIPELSPHHRDVIRRFVGDSFFSTVLLCSSVAGQKNLPQTLSTRNLREFAIRQPLANALRGLCAVDKALKALAVYAACAPVRSGDEAIRSSAASHAGLSASDIELLEQRVVAAGLFQLDGQGLIRPVPDLVGDLIIEETCLNEQGRPTPFGQTLIRSLFEQQRYEPVIRNCGDVARLFSTPARVDFLSELVLERASGLSAQTARETFELLDSCSGLAARQPAAIVRLIEVLTAKSALRPAVPVRELTQTDNPEVRAQVLLATAGEHDPTIVPRALEYARRLLGRARGDENVYVALREKLTASCQFAVARALTHATAVLDVLNGWADGTDLESAELAAAVVRGFLRVPVRLNPSEEIWKLRNRALDILVRCTRHAAPAVQYAAAESLASWAHGHSDLAGDLRERWVPQLTRELEILAESFSKLASTTTHLPVRAAIEQQGWNWWLDNLEPFIQLGGKRILEALPADEAYALWKALHAAKLPVFPIAPDESIEPQQRRDRLRPQIEPSAERVADLANELFDRLDLTFNSPTAWSAVFTSVLSALPQQPLQPRARVYLAELAKRHCAQAWSFVTEGNAEGPLGAILPALLAELRGQDPGRWHEGIQRSVPGTRLFEVELGALCAAGELDPVERSMVSKGLELDDADAVHLAAQALLSAPRAALGGGLAAVIGVLPRRPTDERLWELTLDAFARWGEHVLRAPEAEETHPELRAASGELLRLLRTYGNSLSWEEGPHTRCLTTVVAIFAVTIPHTLKSWMRELRSPSARGAEVDLLSAARLTEVVRLVANSPTATYWQKQFVEWTTQEPVLATTALEILGEFVATHRRSPQFIADALQLLRCFVDTPSAYEVLEKEMISAMALGQEPTRAGGGADGRTAVLEAIDRSSSDINLPPRLSETLARARQAIQTAMEEDLLKSR